MNSSLTAYILLVLSLLVPSALQAQEPRSRSTPKVVEQIESLINNPESVSIKGGRGSAISSHIQGMSVLHDGTWAMSHDDKGREVAFLYFADPTARQYLGKYEFAVTHDTNAYPSGLQACGNIVALTTGDEKKIRFFDCSDRGNIRQLNHLTISYSGGVIENVALAWHPALQRYVLFGHSKYLYVSTSDDLTNANTSFTYISTLSGPTIGEAGQAFIHEDGTNNFYLFSLGRNGGKQNSSTHFTVWRINIGTTVSNPSASTRYVAANTNVTPNTPSNITTSVNTVGTYELKDTSGSFRWGGTAHVNSSGHLQVIAAPRDLNAVGISSFGVWTSTEAEAPAGTKQYELTITKVVCSKASERSGDEVYLKFSNGTRFPAKGEVKLDNDDDSKTPNIWKPKAKVTFLEGSTISVSLMEEDNVADDTLGTIKVSTMPISSAMPVFGDGGMYTIYYEVK